MPKRVENFTVTLIHTTDSADLVILIQWKASSVAMHLRICYALLIKFTSQFVLLVSYR